MKKTLITISLLLLQVGLVTSAFANMNVTFLPAQNVGQPIPNTFAGKLTKFFYQAGIYGKAPAAIVDVEDKNHNVVEITLTDADFAFGSSLHSEIGKNVSLLMLDREKIATQFTVLYDENRWYQSANAIEAQK